MWAAQHIDARSARASFISSGGLGTMGFGFPASIGAAIGCPDKTVVCVAGDGSFQMNSQEMATAAIQRRAGEGARHGQPLPGHGAPVAAPVLRRALLVDAARRQPRLREAGRRVRLAGRTRVERPRRAWTPRLAAMLAAEGPVPAGRGHLARPERVSHGGARHVRSTTLLAPSMRQWGPCARTCPRRTALTGGKGGTR